MDWEAIVREIREYAYSQAEDFGFLKKGIRHVDGLLLDNARYCGEYITRRTWDYNKLHETNISDGLENRIIFSNCAYAGMYFAANLRSNDDIARLVGQMESYGMNDIYLYVGEQLGIPTMLNEALRGVLFGIGANTFNAKYHLWDDSTAYNRWEYYKDITAAMFEVGVLHYKNR